MLQTRVDQTSAASNAAIVKLCDRPVKWCCADDCPKVNKMQTWFRELEPDSSVPFWRQMRQLPSSCALLVIANDVLQGVEDLTSHARCRFGTLGPHPMLCLGQAWRSSCCVQWCMSLGPTLPLQLMCWQPAVSCRASSDEPASAKRSSSS